MLHFPQRDTATQHLYAEETDAPLPKTLNPRMRYAYFSTIAKGGKSLIQSCRDLYLGRTVCYKTLRPEFREELRFLVCAVSFLYGCMKSAKNWTRIYKFFLSCPPVLF